MSPELLNIKNTILDNEDLNFNIDRYRDILLLHFSEYFDKLEEDILLGEVSLKFDRFKIDEELWNRVKILSDQGFVIGGSVILNIYGFIDREVGDIDIWLSKDEIKFDDSDIVDSVEDSDGYVDGYVDEDRVKVDIKGIGVVDVFNYVVNHYRIGGINVNSPFNAIRAKMKYKRKKDIIDFFNMVRNI